MKQPFKSSAELRPEAEARVLAALDPEAMAADIARLVRERSVTGDERCAVETLAQIADERGLAATVQRHDLEAVRGVPGYPGEEAPRDELLGALVELPGSGSARLCLNGHLDVVAPGSEPWRDAPVGGGIADGDVHGCGGPGKKARGAAGT